MKSLFIILASWIVIITIGLLVGFIFNKIIIEKELLKIFNISLGLILFAITIYFIWTIKNLL